MSLYKVIFIAVFILQGCTLFSLVVQNGANENHRAEDKDYKVNPWTTTK